MVHTILTPQASLLELFTKATLCCYLFYITCNCLMKIFHNERFHQIIQENELPVCFPRYNIPEPQKHRLQDFNLLFRVDLARAGCPMLCPARFCHNLCKQPVPVFDPPLQQNIFPLIKLEFPALQFKSISSCPSLCASSLLVLYLLYLKYLRCLRGN